MMKVQHMLARVVSALLLTGVFVVVSAARADAGLILYVCNDAACAGGGVDAITVDGDADGLVSFVDAGFTVDAAVTYPAVGTPGSPYLSVLYVISTAGFAKYGPTPYIYAAQDGFTASPGLAYMDANSSNSGGTATLYTGAGAFVPGAAAVFSCTSTNLDCNGTAPVGAAPYYLALGVNPFSGGSGDSTVTVPDGGSTVALLGSVLFAFGAFRRKFNGR